MNPAWIILTLKVAVTAVTVLLIASLIAIAKGRRQLHGRINLAFFVLTLGALLGLEGIIRFVEPEIFDAYLERHGAKTALVVHLAFAAPAALLLFLMLFTGLRRRRTAHLLLGFLFLALWTGTFVTGIFFLPHAD